MEIPAEANCSFEKIRQLVGNISQEQMRHVESFLGDKIAVFIPQSGPCYYSLSENHTHPGFSFYYSFGSGMHVSINGKIIESHPGRLYCFSPDIVHHELPSDELVRFIAILIDPVFFHGLAAQYPKNLSILAGEEFILPEGLRYAIKEFMSETSSILPGRENMIAAHELKITHCILRGIFALKADQEKIVQRFEIDKAIEFFTAHFEKEISIDDAAAEANLSVSYFSRLFKEETGTTPQEYLIGLRLSRAKRELLNSSKKMTEIALDCGFSSHSHFTSTFSSRFGVSPSEFRKKI